MSKISAPCDKFVGQTKELKMLPVELIRLDGDTSPRVVEPEEKITEYAQDMNGGATFPPPIVFLDDEGNYWPGKGHLTIKAAKLAGLNQIEAELRRGTQRDAVLYSLGENSNHGVKRNRDDIRRVVERILQDAEWKNLTDRQIAKCCRVSHTYVSSLRKKLKPPPTGDQGGGEKQNHKPQTEDQGGGGSGNVASKDEQQGGGGSGNVASKDEQQGGGGSGNVASTKIVPPESRPSMIQWSYFARQCPAVSEVAAQMAAYINVPEEARDLARMCEIIAEGLKVFGDLNTWIELPKITPGVEASPAEAPVETPSAGVPPEQPLTPEQQQPPAESSAETPPAGVTLDQLPKAETPESGFQLGLFDEDDDPVVATGQKELLQKLGTDRGTFLAIMNAPNHPAWPEERKNNEWVWRKSLFDPVKAAVDEELRKRQQPTG